MPGKIRLIAPGVNNALAKAQSNAQSHRIRAQIDGLGAQASSGTLSTETVEVGP
jgi:hypothetical protein